MNVFNPLDHLISQHEHCLQREHSVAPPKQLLYTAPELVHDHAVPLLVLSKPVNLRNANPVLKDFVNFVLVDQLALVLRYGLLLRNAHLLLFFGWVLQVLDLDCVLVLLFGPVAKDADLRIDVHAAPHFTEAP